MCKGCHNAQGHHWEIGGKKVSKIMFVVGSDTRLPHPGWKENYAFAQKLAHKMEEMYPGLLKGFGSGRRYNQHISHGAILLEMGGTEIPWKSGEGREMFAEY